MVEGFTFLHGHGVAHMDIKSANIVIDTSLERLYIIDFGLAHTVNSPEDTVSGFRGTKLWVAPEIAGDGDTYSAIRADLWAIGELTETVLVCGTWDQLHLKEVSTQLLSTFTMSHWDTHTHNFNFKADTSISQQTHSAFQMWSWTPPWCRTDIHTPTISISKETFTMSHWDTHTHNFDFEGDTFMMSHWDTHTHNFDLEAHTFTVSHWDTHPYDFDFEADTFTMSHWDTHPYDFDFEGDTFTMSHWDTHTHDFDFDTDTFTMSHWDTHTHDFDFEAATFTTSHWDTHTHDFDFEAAQRYTHPQFWFRHRHVHDVTLTYTHPRFRFRSRHLHDVTLRYTPFSPNTC